MLNRFRCSESGTWRPSDDSTPQLHPFAHALHSQVRVHRPSRSAAVLLLPTVSNPTLVLTERSRGRQSERVCFFFFFLQEREGQSGREHVHALHQRAGDRESRG